MRPRHALFLLLAAAFVLPAPPAAAHGTHGFEAGEMVGDLYVSLSLEPLVVMADTATPVAVSVTRADGAGPPDVDGVNLTLLGPDNAAVPVDLRNGSARFVGELTFPAPGAWRMNVTLSPGNGSVELPVTVYPAGPYIWESPNAVMTLFAAGHDAEIQLRVLEWRTLGRAPAPDDVTLRVERWTDKGTEKLGESVIDTEPTAPGFLVAHHVFDEPGAYRLRLASPTLGLDYEDRPDVRLQVLSCEDVLRYDESHACAKKATPGAGAGGAVLALVAALAVARRARRA